MRRVLLATISIALSNLGCALAATPELRGTWVTTTGITTGTISTPLATNTNFARMRTLGLNTIYQDVWRNGTSYYPSTTLAAITGTALAPDAAGRDIVDQTMIAAHRNGMQNIGWLQYGFAAQFIGSSGSTSNALGNYMNTRGWLLKDQAGAVVNSTNSFAWMNPLVPEVRSLLINMTVEMVKKYDLDGVQFDDRLAWPINFGYDSVTAAAYLAETGNALPSSPTNTAFKQWRAGKVTAFAKEFSAALRTANPNLIISAAPSVYPFGYDSYCADWPSWTTQSVTANGQTYPLFDEIIPQVYRSTASGFTSEWNSEIAVTPASRLQDLAAGISINNSAGAPYDWTTINLPQVQSQRSSTAKRGQVWWYSAGVLTDEANLTSFYNVAGLGQADHPDRASDHRPAPTTSVKLDATTYRFTVAAADRYTLIAKTGDTWKTIWSNVLGAGVRDITLAGYTSTELLVDRRGWQLGDLNFDRKVDFVDLLTLAQNYESPGVKVWTQGDFNLDGTVNFDDLLLLAQHYDPAARLIATDKLGSDSFQSDWHLARTLIPEPTMFGGSMFVSFFLRRRR